MAFLRNLGIKANGYNNPDTGDARRQRNDDSSVWCTMHKKSLQPADFFKNYL